MFLLHTKLDTSPCERTLVRVTHEATVAADRTRTTNTQLISVVVLCVFRELAGQPRVCQVPGGAQLLRSPEAGSVARSRVISVFTAVMIEMIIMMMVIMI